MSSLQAVKSFRLELDLVYQIIKEYSHLRESGKRIVICWIPTHVNIPGNEKADSAAKSALTLPITKMKIPATEYIPGVSQFCLKEWQDIWNCCEGNKLHAIYPNVGRMPHCKNLSQRYAVVINRTDYESVILASRTCTCLQAKIYQHVSFAVFHALLITYFWNVPT